MAGEVLSERALNRATLARQLLLERADIAPREAVAHLVGMQAQEPQDPYLGVWSRLARFRPQALSGLIESRELVRIVVMRGTIHLVTADDCRTLRPLVQPVLDDELARHSEHKEHLRGRDLAPVTAAARGLLEGPPLTMAGLRAALAERFPGESAAALAYACRNTLPLVQVPPRGLWGRSAQVAYVTAESWLGRPMESEPSIGDVVLRYLAAFGPATPADVAAWSGLTGMRAVVDRLRPRLLAVRDERGRELLDLPGAPRPDPATPAPPRFLPRYDNVLLSHADRGRFISDEDRRRLAEGPTPDGSVLIDGRAAATWRLEREADGSVATAVVRCLRPPPARAAAAVAAEGRRMLRLLAPGAERREVRFQPLGDVAGG